MQNFVQFFNPGPYMGYNANKKNMGRNKFLKNEQIICKLLEIIANGLYAICHWFGGWLVGLLSWRVLKVLSTYSQHMILPAVAAGYPSNGRRSSSIPVFLLQSPKPAPTGLPTPSSRGRLCAAQAWRPHPIPITCHEIRLLTHTSCYSLAMAASHPRLLTPQPSQ